MIKKTIFLVSVLCNFFLICMIYNPKKMSLADVAVSISSVGIEKDYNFFYKRYGSPYSDEMNYVTDGDLSFLYDLNERSFFLFDSNGPIFSYVKDDINIYSKNFNGSFYDRYSGITSFDRKLSVLSYYNDKNIMMGGVESFPEIILNVTKETSDDASSMAYILQDAELVGIYKSGRECKFLDSEGLYFACCANDLNSDVESYHYWPFNEKRWGKNRNQERQQIYDQACNEFYKSGVEPDSKQRKELGEYFLNQNIDAFIKSLKTFQKN